MGNEHQITTAFIAAVAGIVTTYITVRFKDRQNKEEKPKDRLEAIFDGYEDFIKQLRVEISRKEDLIGKLQIEIDKYQGIVDTLKAELDQSKNQIAILESKLETMKSKFTK